MRQLGKAVVVTTKHKGVFFGYSVEYKPGQEIIMLKNARNCIYWRGIKGVIDLATTGPTNDCRVGPQADIELRDITCVLDCTKKACQAWEKAPW